MQMRSTNPSATGPSVLSSGSSDLPQDQKKYSIGEASKFLGVSIDTLRRWEKAGKIKALRSPGGHRYFLKKDLEGAFGQKYSRSKTLVTEYERPKRQDSSTASEASPEPEDNSQPEPQTVAPPPPPPPITTYQQPQTEESETSRLQANDTIQQEASPPQEAAGEIKSLEQPEATAPQEETRRFTTEEIPPTPQAQLPETPTPTTEVSAPQTPDTLEPIKERVSPQPQKATTSASSIVTQKKEGSSTLKKVSIFLLIVFLMVNIILIGFYIFVSNQL